MDEFLLPGVFDPLRGSDEAILHQAGMDYASIAADPADDYGRQLPQFGPPFVRYVHERFNAMDKAMDKALAKWMYEPVTVFIIASMQTDGSGNLGQTVQGNTLLWETPPGQTLALHRLTIRDVAHTFGAPYTNAASYWELRVDNEMIDGHSMVSGVGQLPVVVTYGTRDAPHIRDGEGLSLFMSGGPINTQVVVKGQGTLDRTAEG